MDNNWEGSGGISEFRLGNPPPVQMATLVAPLERTYHLFMINWNWFKL